LEYFLHTTQFIVFLIVALSTLILALYYLILFKVNKPILIKTNFKEGISVIVAAKNERENLTQNLTHLLNQDYLNFEIIVVNDGSFDGTKKLLTMSTCSLLMLTVNQIPLNGYNTWRTYSMKMILF